MKTLSQYIQEKLIIKKGKSKSANYKYFPKTKEELKDIILQRIQNEGNKVNLNNVDVSNIADMSNLFENTDFNGDISGWDVSNVGDMSEMFFNCKSFNQDISKWDVSKVTNMAFMFYMCKNFNQDISTWDVSKVKFATDIFYKCSIEEKYKPKFK